MLLVKNGLVVDGTGRPALKLDVVVEGDRIRDLVAPGGVKDAAADTVVDAAGALVTPGFIDAHTHSDAYLLIEPDAPSKLAQGITTELNGQCGGSAVPRYGAARLSSDWASMTYPSLEAMSHQPRATSHEPPATSHEPRATSHQPPATSHEPPATSHPGPTWRSMAEYRALFDAVRPAVNTVQFVGHNTLRSSVIGYDAVKATPETLEKMKNLLAQSLDDGGWGLTTGLIYQPGKYSDAAEVTALARVAAERGGFYATHMRSEGDNILAAIDEVLDLVRATGIRAEISHLKTSGKRNWGKIDAVLEKIQGAIDADLLLGSDRYPYCAAGTDLDVVLPDWAGEGGRDPELARIRDSATRAKIVAELDASGRDWTTVMLGGGWSDLTRAWSGKTMAEAAAGLKKSPGEIVCDFILADLTRTGAFFFGMSEENLQKIYERPWIVPGTDASLRAPWGPLGKDHPHPRAYGTMPRFFRMLTGRVEGHAKVCSREEAIRRMTSLPAERFAIRGRGVIEKGAFADLAVWREDDFADTATYLKPHSFAAGVVAVVVNGALSYSHGQFTHRRAGRFLTRG